MIRAHIDAVVALLNASPNVVVHDGIVPNNAALPYVVVFADQGAADPTSLAYASDWRTFHLHTTCVGSTQLQVRALAERVDAALLDQRPTVAGRSVAPLRKALTQPVRQDTDVDPPVLFAADVWVLSSVPA